MLQWLALAAVIILFLLLLYWLLIITEGVFLGRRIVVWLYDLTASRYDSIKEFDVEDERFGVSRPLLQALAGRSNPLLLDVATGTGRVPFALLREASFTGRVIGLEPSGPMLSHAAVKLRPLRDTIELVQQTAVPLPFAANTFDAVTCLEALEFMPSDHAALQEMVRVLRPGGFLMTSRRTGWQAKTFLGRYRSPANFEALLTNLGLTQVQTHLWEVDYDRVTGWKI